MEDNPENPVYECKEKYVKKYFFDPKKLNVYCIGLKFSPQGNIHSWGVASFSCDGKLIGEEGSIRLTNRLTPEERRDIKNDVTNYITKNPKCELKSKRVSDFLEQLGPSMENQLIFANKFFTNTPLDTLRPVFENIKPLVQQSNIKGILISLLKAAETHTEYLAIDKSEDSDSYLLVYSKALKPVQHLLVDNNKFSISFPDFIKFIYQCEEPKNAPRIASIFTKDIPKLLDLLNTSYSLIKEPFVKNRVRRILTALRKEENAKSKKSSTPHLNGN